MCWRNLLMNQIRWTPPLQDTSFKRDFSFHRGTSVFLHYAAFHTRVLLRIRGTYKIMHILCNSKRVFRPKFSKQSPFGGGTQDLAVLL